VTLNGIGGPDQAGANCFRISTKNVSASEYRITFSLSI
jgi:hypothetical protein